MANTTVAQDVEQMKRIKDVAASALVWLKGDAARTQAAIDQAMANGATAEELAPLSALVDETEAVMNDVAAAIATPGPVTPA